MKFDFSYLRKSAINSRKDQFSMNNENDGLKYLLDMTKADKSNAIHQKNQKCDAKQPTQKNKFKVHWKEPSELQPPSPRVDDNIDTIYAIIDDMKKNMKKNPNYDDDDHDNFSNIASTHSKIQNNI